MPADTHTRNNPNRSITVKPRNLDRVLKEASRREVAFSRVVNDALDYYFARKTDTASLEHLRQIAGIQPKE